MCRASRCSSSSGPADALYRDRLIKPDITLKDYKDISVPRPHSEIGDKEVDEALERLRLRFAELHAAERPVQAGDFLTVDTHILKSGAVLIGESETDAQLEVDKERLITGLAEGLIGQAVGETRDIALTLPADYPKKDLAGQNVVFRITVKSIKERRLPPLDDEAGQAGRTRPDLRGAPAGGPRRVAGGRHQSDEQRFENDVLKALDERMEVEVPEALIEREVSRRIRELETRLQEQGVKMDGTCSTQHLPRRPQGGTTPPGGAEGSAGAGSGNRRRARRLDRLRRRGG